MNEEKEPVSTAHELTTTERLILAARALVVQPSDSVWIVDAHHALVELAGRLELATAVVVALREFEAVQVEIDAARAEGACVPMSELAIGLGGRSIDAWQRVDAALKAVKL